eukprot:743695-Prymnesium_polylepis.2
MRALPTLRGPGQHYFANFGRITWFCGGDREPARGTMLRGGKFVRVKVHGGSVFWQGGTWR